MQSHNQLRQVLFSTMAKLREKSMQGDFWSYCLYMNLPFFSKRVFLKKVASAYQEVFEAFGRGERLRVAVSMPPRAGKSYITTLFVTFMLGHYPGNSVMRNCVTAKLYRKFSKDARNIIKSEKFASIFPDVMISEDAQSLEAWYLKDTDSPAYFGAGVGGAIIGFGANMLAITDDLFKGFQDAMSETVNENTWLWKEGEHDTRTERNCSEIDIGTRWSKDDIIGRREENGDYDIVVRIPALNEHDETFCRDVHTTEYYLEKRATIDEMIFNAEYQQEPIESSGLLFPKTSLQFFEFSEIEKIKPIAVIGVCDSADTGSDFFSAPIAYLMPDHKFYIVDVVFSDEPVEITEPLLIGAIMQYKPQWFLIESNNGGRIFSVSVQKALRGKVSTMIETRATTAHKETKILMRSGFIKDRFVFRKDIANNNNYAKFMHNLTSYVKMGTNKKDDAPDSLTILAEYIEYLGLDTFKEKDYTPISKASLGLR